MNFSKISFAGRDVSAQFEAAVRMATERRHYLHRHPQMAYEETVASGVVQDALKGMGLDYKVMAGTGIVVDIQGLPSPDNRIMAFRGDMDALPVTEATGLPYASENPGFMHACGHDGHTVMLLSSAEMLFANRDKFRGTVRLIFQPAEELGAKGAKSMIEGGCFEGMNPARDPVFAYHNWPSMRLGTAATSGGAIMAAADYYNVTVKGRDGHVGMPDIIDNPIPVAAEIITEIYKLERSVNAGTRQISLETTQLAAPHGPLSAVPGEVKLGGSLRSFDPKLRKELQGKIEGICRSAQINSITVEFGYKVGTDPTINDPTAAAFATKASAALFGEAQVSGDVAPAYTAEDFGCMLQEHPGAYIWLGQGTGDPKNAHDQTLHAATYNFNDKLIPVALALTLKLVEEGLPVEGPSAYSRFEL